MYKILHMRVYIYIYVNITSCIKAASCMYMCMHGDIYITTWPFVCECKFIKHFTDIRTL